MIAYNKEALEHLSIHQNMEDIFVEECITKEERDAIHAKFPVKFYSPNIFIRIGLFILTIIIMLFSFGLMVLVLFSSVEKMLGAISIFFAVFAYLGLEYVVREKKHFRSGVDDALLWGSAFALFAGISFSNGLSDIATYTIVLVITILGGLRFINKLMMVAAYCSMLALIFSICIALGNSVKAFVPFIIMGASLFIYVASKKLKIKQTAFHYRDCLDLIRIASLLSFYMAGNYFVVRELSNSMFHLNLQAAESIPFGWLFWIFTISIPGFYILRGIQKKDAILLRVGLLLVAAIVFTIRYYHSILPMETTMTVTGIGLLIIGYSLMKYLQEPKYGFTYRELSKKHMLDKLKIESLVLAETFTPGIETDATKFGGGSFGGGGSSGDY